MFGRFTENQHSGELFFLFLVYVEIGLTQSLQELLFSVIQIPYPARKQSQELLLRNQHGSVSHFVRF